MSLILPCYSETDVFAGSVSRIVDVLRSSKLRYEIIFVDDGSRDGTQCLIKLTHFRAIYHQKNMGKGKTVADCIVAAKGTVVGYIDIDCEVGSEYIPQMVSIILQKKAYIVIGIRIYRTSAGSLVREILSRGCQWLNDVMIGTGKLDTEAGYKFFDRKKCTHFS